MKPKVGQYYYTISNNKYRIYRYTHADENGALASPVSGEPLYPNPEEARKRVYELNGWKYTPRNNEHTAT